MMITSLSYFFVYLVLVTRLLKVFFVPLTAGSWHLLWGTSAGAG
jgi:hypothetical protein